MLISHDCVLPIKLVFLEAGLGLDSFSHYDFMRASWKREMGLVERDGFDVTIGSSRVYLGRG